MPGSYGYAANTGGRTTCNRDVFRPPLPTRSSLHTTNVRRKDSRPPRPTNPHDGSQQRPGTQTSSYASNGTSSSYHQSQPRWQPTSDQDSVRKRPRLGLYQPRPPSPRPSSRTPTNIPPRSSTSYFPSYRASDSSLRTSLRDDSTAAASQCSDFDVASPSPLVNTSYRLAGGLDTPTASYEKRLEDFAIKEAESDWRVDRFRREDEYRTSPFNDSPAQASDLGRSASFVGEDGEFHRVSSPRTPYWNDNKSKGLKRNFDDSSAALSSPRGMASKSLSGWNIRSTAWALTGGLAAKAINFCVSAAFGGFRAGGGIAYKMGNGVSVSGGIDIVVEKHIPSSQDVFSSAYQPPLRPTTNVPGGFVDENWVEDEPARQMLESRPWPDSTPTGNSRTAAAAPSQLDRSSLRNDWQIINHDHVESNTSTTTASPARRRSRASVAGAGSAAVSSSYHGNTWGYNSSTDLDLKRFSTASSSGASYASPRSKTAVSSYGAANPPALLRRTSTSTSTSTSSKLHKSPDRRLPPHRPSSHRPSSSSSSSHNTFNPSWTSASISSSTSTSTSTSVNNPTSPRRTHPSSLTRDTTPTPYSPQIAASHRRKLQRRSARDDEKLAQMNAQMREMIRVGKEALGTKIDVFDSHCGGHGGGGGGGMEDEGYGEGFDDDDDDDDDNDDLMTLDDHHVGGSRHGVYRG